MRYLAEKRGKPIAILLCAVLVGPILLSPLAGTAAHAQYVAPPRWRIGVLDFTVAKGVHGASQELVAKVVERMYLGLKATRRYEVVSPREVENEVAALGVAPPYETGEMKLLCDALNLDGVVRGEVTGLSVDGGKRASISLDAVIWDGVAEENVNGAEASSVSPAHPGFAGDAGVVLDSVIAEATTQAATMLAGRPIITGTILLVDAFGNVYLNVGGHQGLREGMTAVALERRFDDATKQEYHVRVGLLRVVRVSPKEATARITGGTGQVRETNDIRVVYEKPVTVGGATGTQVRKNSGKLLLTAAALLVLIGVFMNRTAGIEAITSIQAQATSTVENAVLVQWTPRSNLPTEPGVIASEVLGYIVYRSENPFIEGDFDAIRKLVLGGSLSRLVDDARPESSATTIEVDDNGVVTISSGEATTTDESTASLGAASSRQAYTNSLTVNVSSQGLVPGVHYYYAVQCVSKFQVFGGAAGGTLVIGTRSDKESSTAGRIGEQQQAGRQEEITRRFVVALSDWSSVFGPVTPLARPTLTSPASIPDPGSQDVSPYGADFRWNSVAGGDTYILQVGPITSGLTTPFTTPEVFTAGETAGVIMTQNVNIFNIFATAEPKNYFWRVGVRSSRDRLRPAPDGYVFSEIRSFRTLESPPPPP